MDVMNLSDCNMPEGMARVLIIQSASLLMSQVVVIARHQEGRTDEIDIELLSEDIRGPLQALESAQTGDEAADAIKGIIHWCAERLQID